MCGGHHIAGGGGKVHELGGRILGLEADDVRGDVVNLLVRFRVMHIDKVLSRCDWETVFPTDDVVTYLVRKASDTRLTLMKKRCAWYLRAELKSHSEWSFKEGEEFLEMMSMDRRSMSCSLWTKGEVQAAVEQVQELLKMLRKACQ